MRQAASFVALFAAAAAAAPSPAPLVALDPPPGWRDVSAQTRVTGLILALRGPERSSFVLTRMPEVPLDNGAAVRSFLMNVLEGIRGSSRLDYRASDRLESRSLRNGLDVQLLRADLSGRPRLLLAVFRAGGRPVLASLSSAAPEAMVTPLLGSMRVAAGEARDSGSARSLDGQLEVALGGGLRSRDPAPQEKDRGAVLALQSSGAEVVFYKLGVEDAAPKDQPAVTRATVAGALKVPLETVSLPRSARSPAGPSAVYCWARLPSSPDQRLAAGFLPWGYWGYSLIARGPLADELLVGVLAALKQGPAAVPGLVAASPDPDIPPDRARLYSRAAFALVLLLLVLLVWSRGRKSANLSP